MNKQVNLLKIQVLLFLFLLLPLSLFAQEPQVLGQEKAILTGSSADNTILIDAGEKSVGKIMTGTSPANPDDYINAKSEWGLLGGYGVSHPGWGETRTRVQTVDFVYRYGYFLSGETGKSWYRGRPELLVEVPFSSVQSPKDGQMIGFNLLISRNFTSSKKIVPYVFAGAGLVYTNLDISDLGTEFNGSYQMGTGLRFFVSDGISFDLNCRFHHLSNGNTAEPNISLNSTKIFFGISFYR